MKITVFLLPPLLPILITNTLTSRGIEVLSKLDRWFAQWNSIVRSLKCAESVNSDSSLTLVRPCGASRPFQISVTAIPYTIQYNVIHLICAKTQHFKKHIIHLLYSKHNTWNLAHKESTCKTAMYYEYCSKVHSFRQKWAWQLFSLCEVYYSNIKLHFKGFWIKDFWCAMNSVQKYMLHNVWPV